MYLRMQPTDLMALVAFLHVSLYDKTVFARV